VKDKLEKIFTKIGGLVYDQMVKASIRNIGIATVIVAAVIVILAIL